MVNFYVIQHNFKIFFLFNLLSHYKARTYMKNKYDGNKNTHKIHKNTRIKDEHIEFFSIFAEITIINISTRLPWGKKTKTD